MTQINSYNYFGHNPEVETLIRPFRPILGSKIKNNFNDWMTTLSMRQRMDSWSTSSVSDSDDSPSVLTPIGSPQKWSPVLWSQSVPFNTNSILNGRQSLLNDGYDPRSEFETNGKDVPIIDTIDKTITRPVTKVSQNQYEMFGRNGFSYAKVKPLFKEREVVSIESRVRNKRRVKTQTFCSFCKNNNETPEVYNSHVVKDPDGRTSCPVLRGYDCPKCRSGGGDTGHTIRYCPLNKPGVRDYIPSVIKQLKNSRSADGKKRGGVVVQTK